MEKVNEFLTFLLDNEVYAIDINSVREVLDLPKITAVPNMPVYVRGVINLRGKVVPVIDLRKKFNLHPTEDTVRTCIIIMEVALDGIQTLLGAVADSVQEVMRIDDAVIETPPRLGNRLNTEFISGMINRDDDFVIVLDINRVFSLEELGVITGEIGEG